MARGCSLHAPLESGILVLERSQSLLFGKVWLRVVHCMHDSDLVRILVLERSQALPLGIARLGSGILVIERWASGIPIGIARFGSGILVIERSQALPLARYGSGLFMVCVVVVLSTILGNSMSVLSPREERETGNPSVAILAQVLHWAV